VKLKPKRRPLGDPTITIWRKPGTEHYTLPEPIKADRSRPAPLWRKRMWGEELRSPDTLIIYIPVALVGLPLLVLLVIRFWGGGL
jgi:hypothetical protein